jgi:hypothetical protein
MILRVQQIDDLSSAGESYMVKGGDGLDMTSSGTYAQMLKKGFNQS